MKTEKKAYERTLLIITIVCEIIAYLLALVMIFAVLKPFYTNLAGSDDFFWLLLVIVLFIRMLVFYYLRRKEIEPVWKQGSAALVASAIRQQVSLLIVLTLVLYFAGWSSGVSRAFTVFLIFFGIVLDVISGKLYARHYLSGHTLADCSQKVLLVCEEEETERLKHYIEQFGSLNESKNIHSDCLVSHITHPGNIVLPETGCDAIFLSYKAQEKLTGRESAILEQSNLPFSRELYFNHFPLSRNMITELGKSAVVFESRMSRTCDVLGVRYTSCGKEESVRYIADHCRELKGEYICFSNVHTTVTAYDDNAYRDILNAARYVMPDGHPIAKEMVKKGFFEAERVAGPDFMDEMFRVTSGTEISHYFYGSSEETIARLKESLTKNYPGIRIAGMVSPPFRALTEEEDEAAVKAINDSKADLIWIGLGAPKQEKWMNAHKGRVNGVMLGVGAGFDFHAGTIKRAPVLIQKIGLEWLYRLFQDPKRLFKRYFVTNTRFIWLTSILRK